MAGDIWTWTSLCADTKLICNWTVGERDANWAQYAQLVKVYGAAPDGEHRYSPPEVTACKARVRSGRPDPAHIATSYVERSNLSMRMHMRRFTRLPNAH